MKRKRQYNNTIPKDILFKIIEYQCELNHIILVDELLWFFSFSRFNQCMFEFKHRIKMSPLTGGLFSKADIFNHVILRDGVSTMIRVPFCELDETEMEISDLVWFMLHDTGYMPRLLGFYEDNSSNKPAYWTYN